MSTIEELKTRTAENRRELRQSYLDIVHRECTSNAEAADVAMLGELLPELGKSEADFAADCRNYRSFLQAQENAAAIKPDPAALERLQKELTAAGEAMVAAQKEFYAAKARFDAVWSIPATLQMREAEVKRAREDCGALFPDFTPLAAPNHFQRSQVQNFRTM